MRSVLEAAIALQLLVSWYAVCAVHLPTSCTRRTKSLFELLMSFFNFPTDHLPPDRAVTILNVTGVPGYGRNSSLDVAS